MFCVNLSKVRPNSTPVGAAALFKRHLLKTVTLMITIPGVRNHYYGCLNMEVTIKRGWITTKSSIIELNLMYQNGELIPVVQYEHVLHRVHC